MSKQENTSPATIGVQGSKGSFSEQASEDFARYQELSNYKLEYLVSSEGVLSAVENGTVDYGVFAMENAKGGVVVESIKALAAYRCKILKMFHFTVRQNLLVLPGTLLDDISEIHSHRQAIRQCQEFLAKHFWGLPLIEEDDTAESARRLVEGIFPKTAAVIANQACADVYGLEILQKDIHDLKNNLTLFLGVKRIDG